jgi:uncharacterized protein YdeI (YjbR/CyaY-like superfamily)
MREEEKQIDSYLKKLPDFSYKICAKLRRIIHATSIDIEEDWKWGSPAFTYKGKLLCFFWAFSKHVSLTFFEGSLMKDPKKLFNYGESNLRNRSIKFTDIVELESIGEETLIRYLKEAIKNIKDGKAVKIPASTDKTVILPIWFKNILREEGLLAKYEEQIYTYRKGYLRWIEEAKQEGTRQKRIEQMLRELHDGKVYMGMKR